MKSVLFIMRYPLDVNHHLKQKFDGQMQACVNLGYKVFHFGYDTKNVYLVEVNSGKKEIIGKTHMGKMPKYRNSFGFLDLFAAMKKVAKSRKFDYAYMRAKTVNWTAVAAVEKLKENGCKFIVEIPSYQSQEKVLSGARKIVMSVASTWNKKINELTDMYTLIGPDGGGEYRGRPAINIENGICVDTIPVRNYKQQDEIHLLALASMRRWHAYDRLIKGLGEYKGEHKVLIDMVGSDVDGSLEEWKNLAKSYGIGDRVILHGPKYGDDLTKMFDLCDAGVATLGYHRNGIMRGSSLKTREYMARGLSFVYGYEDISISDDFPYSFRVEANDDAVDMDAIVEWVLKVRAKDSIEVSDYMRNYANENMSWESVFKKTFYAIDNK